MSNKYLLGSIFVRIILIFIGMMVPLYLLGWALYSMSTATLREEIIGNLSAQMNFNLNNLENEITRIRGMQFEFMNDEDLNYLANANSIMWSYEKTMTERRVERRILLFKYGSKYIQQVNVHIPNMGNTISSQEGMIDLAPDYFSSLRYVEQNAGQSLQIRSDGWYLYSAYPLRISYEREPLYIVVTLLSREAIDDAFSSSVSAFGGTFAYSPVDNVQFGVINADLNQPIIDAFIKNKESLQSLDIPIYGTYLVYQRHSDYLGIDYYAYISEDQAYEPARKIALIFVLFSIAAISTVVAFSLISRKVVHQPVARLVSAFKHLEDGDLDISIASQAQDEFNYLYKAFNSMVQSIKSLFSKVTSYQLLTREAQLKQLQAQISPHFLHNCLYIIYRMAQMGDIENVMAFTNHLNTYYRYITRDAQNEVPLYKEIEHAHDYTSIQQFRFSNRINIVWGELPEKYRDLIVPRLILQPLIENAYQHGLKDVETEGVLRIRMDEINNGLQIIVENNGALPSKQELEDLLFRIQGDDYDGEVTALRNIHRRLSTRFAVGSGLYPSITEEGFFNICMTIRW